MTINGGIFVLQQVYNKQVSKIWPTIAPGIITPITSLNVIDEGDSVVVNVGTTDFEGQTLYWTIQGVTGTINSSDFSDISGSFVVQSNNFGTLTITSLADATTEGTESFVIQIRTNSTSGPIKATSGTITINDTSLSGPYVATGGTITTPTIGGINYRLHTFTSQSSTFTVASGAGPIEVFIVGGGGGGGVLGGGGGGGGIIFASRVDLPSGSYPVAVGAGGQRETGWSGLVRKGNPSSVFSMTALPGGGGLSYQGNPPGDTNSNVSNTGGNKYGSTGSTSGATSMSFASGWTGVTHGGRSGGGGDSNCCSCRGGGGAGAGANGQSFSGRNGGNGVQINIDGNNFWWGGGGGNDGYCSNTGGNGGLGGGGGGAGASSGSGGGSARNSGANGQGGGSGNGGNGGAGTGGGGGAGSSGFGSTNFSGGNGGSGIVMIRYPI